MTFVSTRMKTLPCMLAPSRHALFHIRWGDFRTLKRKGAEECSESDRAYGRWPCICAHFSFGHLAPGSVQKLRSNLRRRRTCTAICPLSVFYWLSMTKSFRPFTAFRLSFVSFLRRMKQNRSFGVVRISVPIPSTIRFTMTFCFSPYMRSCTLKCMEARHCLAAPEVGRFWELSKLSTVMSEKRLKHGGNGK